jgi:MoaA/NifB/PqqE/SkfB family radical SAM enzyme
MFVLVLTGSCNNNCRFCYQERKFFLDTEKARSLISEAKKSGENHINFFGGEPTIHPDFLGLVRYVKGQGLDFSLNSNLRLLSYKEVAEKIAGFDPVLIQTSLHGHYPEIHDKLTRTPGSFEQTVKGIKNLLDLGYDPGRIVVNTVITKQNKIQGNVPLPGKGGRTCRKIREKNYYRKGTSLFLPRHTQRVLCF